MPNGYPNIFGGKKEPNIYEYEYIRLKIFEYIRMSKYLLHTEVTCSSDPRSNTTEILYNPLKMIHQVNKGCLRQYIFIHN